MTRYHKIFKNEDASNAARKLVAGHTMIAHVFALSITNAGIETIEATRHPNALFGMLADHYPHDVPQRGDVFRTMRQLVKQMVVGRHQLDDRTELLITPIPVGKP